MSLEIDREIASKPVAPQKLDPVAHPLEEIPFPNGNVIRLY